MSNRSASTNRAARLANPIFIGGAPRSGLTLLRLLLDMHPHICCPPDASIVPSIALQWRDIEQTLGEHLSEAYGMRRHDLRQLFRSTIEDLLSGSLAVSGKKRLAEKSAMNAVALDALGSLFPDASLVLLVRDGRDVVASLLQRAWRNPATGDPFEYTQDAEVAARYWSQLVELALQARDRMGHPERVLILRYEQLVEHPEKSLRALFDHIGATTDFAVLDFHRSRKPLEGMEKESEADLATPISTRWKGRWARDLTDSEVESIKPILAPRLAQLGYAPHW